MTPRPVVPLPDCDLLTPGEVARAFHADVKTVWGWGNAGKLGFVLTPGGQRRYYRSEIDAMVNGPEAGR